MQKVHCHFFKKLQLIVGIEFHFSSSQRYLTFPLQYLFTIGYLIFLDLRVVPHFSKKIPRISFYLLIYI